MGAIAAFGSAASPSGETILVVEDEVLVRLALAETLRDEGYSVIEAANGDEALAVLATPTPIAVILTDVNMPGSLDGVALGRYVRSTRPALKVIIVSGRAAPDRAKDAADAFLAKPYDPQDIVRAIASLLAGRPQ
jgi:two-component system, response regulator PdtaR